MFDWKKINGEWYCYKGDTLVKGWLEYKSGVWYYFDKTTGKMMKGWINDDSKWYYLYPDNTMKDGENCSAGTMATDWIQDGSRWYYLYTERTEKDGQTHYTGEMATGWINLNSIWYYLYTQKTENNGNTYYTGEMAVSTTIDGWSIDSHGVATENMTSGTKEENAKYIYNFFINKGWSKSPICAMLGNIEYESGGINPNEDEWSGAGGYGLVQWTPKSKLVDPECWIDKEIPKKYKEKYGDKWYERLDAQCEKIEDECSHNYQFSGSTRTFSEYSVDTINNVEYLTKEFARYYEKPKEDALKTSLPGRVKKAEDWYKKL